MTDMKFTEDDIRRQLENLGYHSVPRHRLAQFAKDLDRLIEEEGIPTPSDDSLYSDLSDHSGISSCQSQDDSTRRAPLYDVHVPTQRRKNHSHSSYPGSSQMKETGFDKENHQSVASTDPRQRGEESLSDTSKVVDPSTYDPYQRRSTKPAADRQVPMKRKVVRKCNGQSQVFDESVTESESDISYLNERLQGLPLNDDQTDSETSSVGFNSFRRHVGRPNTSQGLYSHRPAGDEDTVYKPHLPRSFIRPSSANPTSKHNKKTDPVTRHQMYQAKWNSQKAPGEKNHKGLRWSVREHMMYKDEVVQPRGAPRVYVPNSYVVPSDKKRQALRWAVRTQLAHREMPSTSFNF